LHLIIAFGATLGCVGHTTSDQPDPAEVSGLAVAAPEFGVQFHIPKFAVPVGTDRVDCYYFKNPSKIDLYINRFEVVLTKGSHHTLLFEGNVDMPDSIKECGNFNGASPINQDGFNAVFGINGGSRGDDWTLPDGVAYKLRAGRQMAMQVHYVNAAQTQTEGNAGEVYFNLHAYKDPSQVKYLMGMINVSNNTINIPPRATKTFDSTCPNPLSADLHIIGITSHYHSRGTEFDVWTSNTGQYGGDPIYHNTNWNEPAWVTYDPPVTVAAGGGFKYQCSYNNPTDQTISVGPRAEVDEHCRAFVYGYPFEEKNEGTSCFKQDGLAQ